MKNTRFALSTFVLLALLRAPIAFAECCSMGMDEMPRREGGASMRMDGMRQNEGREPDAGSAPTDIGREAVCPVDGMKVRVTEDTPATEFHGQMFYFCNENDQHEFVRHPERYARK